MTVMSPTITREVFRRNRWRLVLTYCLTVLENIFELLYPLMIGIGIDGLIRNEPLYLLPLVVVWFVHSLVEFARQRYDTRAFARIYQRLATQVIERQRGLGASTSHLAARSELMREFITFLEAEVPYIITILIAFLGALVLLTVFDWVVGVYCLLLLIPVGFIWWVHSRATQRLSAGLNDQLEEEITVIETRDTAQIDRHFGQLGRWYIRLSDADARTWFWMQPFLVGLIVLALVRSVGMGMETGEIFAVLAYGLSFTDSLDEVPMMIQQYSRLQDIIARINGEGDEE
jgi:ABC-type multidrug transport system fused ATPase/permease subunit